jgi:hypothetical protein
MRVLLLTLLLLAAGCTPRTLIVPTKKDRLPDPVIVSAECRLPSQR